MNGGNLGPLITDVRRDKVVPGAREAVAVRARVIDSDGVAPNSVRSNDLLPGSFLSEARKIYYESGVRFSGSPFARGGWGGSFRVTMPRDDVDGTVLARPEGMPVA